MAQRQRENTPLIAREYTFCSEANMGTISGPFA